MFVSVFALHANTALFREIEIVILGENAFSAHTFLA